VQAARRHACAKWTPRFSCIQVGYGTDRGIIPIACENIFEKVKTNTDPDLTIKVTSSMLEIYMEKVRDLFNPHAGELKIRNDPKKGFFVEGLTQNAVADYESISKVGGGLSVWSSVDALAGLSAGARRAPPRKLSPFYLRRRS